MCMCKAEVTFTLIILILSIPESVTNTLKLEHNYSRPWLRVDSKLDYENLTDFYVLYDSITPANVLPPSVIRRSPKGECNMEEELWCQGSDKCRINKLPEPNIDLLSIVYPTNRANYYCICDRGKPSVDILIPVTPSMDNITRAIHTKCPKQPACDRCHPEHTVKCIDLGNDKIKCICDPNYMESSNCQDLQNGCIQPHPSATLTGNEACLVGNWGNECFPIPQSLFYWCRCREPSMEDRRLSFPNCLTNKTECTRPLCVGFQPPPAVTVPGPSINLDATSSLNSDGRETCNQTTCECPIGWLGPHCTEKRGEPVPGAWSPWSSCSPDCILPNERSRYTRLQDWHAGNSRTTAIGYRSKFGRCTTDDHAFCVGTYRFWRRCRVTQLCNSWTNTRLSNVVNEAIENAMVEHDKVHRADRVEPLLTTAAALTTTEYHSLNFILIGGALIYSCVCIWIMELQHFIVYYSEKTGG